MITDRQMNAASPSSIRRHEEVLPGQLRPVGELAHAAVGLMSDASTASLIIGEMGVITHRLGYSAERRADGMVHADPRTA